MSHYENSALDCTSRSPPSSRSSAAGASQASANANTLVMSLTAAEQDEYEEMAEEEDDDDDDEQLSESSGDRERELEAKAEQLQSFILHLLTERVGLANGSSTSSASMPNNVAMKLIAAQETLEITVNLRRTVEEKIEKLQQQQNALEDELRRARDDIQRERERMEREFEDRFRQLNIGSVQLTQVNGSQVQTGTHAQQHFYIFNTVAPTPAGLQQQQPQPAPQPALAPAQPHHNHRDVSMPQFRDICKRGDGCMNPECNFTHSYQQARFGSVIDDLDNYVPSKKRRIERDT